VTHAAPIARLTLAYGAGVATGLAGAPMWIAPLLAMVALLAPDASSGRPGFRALVCVSAIGWAGAVAAPVVCHTVGFDREARVTGRFLATPRMGSAPFERSNGCGPITVVVPDRFRSPEPTAGRLSIVEGRWRRGTIRPWFEATSVEGVSVDLAFPDAERVRVGPLGELRWTAVRWRDGLVGRLSTLYGGRAPLVAALVFARREGMDRTVRDAFALTGIAHLLAISGFHVGVVAGLALGALRLAGVGHRRAGPGAAVVAWMYVGLIGFPDAATRAALILGLVAVARARGRPASRWSALSVAGLILLVLDPTKLASAGFQLSFAGAAGLIAWARPSEAYLSELAPRWLPRAFVSALAAGFAATAATLPVVAWHFERVSLVGVPMTLLASPLVALALPGALASIVLDPFLPGVAAFVAGGVDVLLALLVGATTLVGEWPGISIWTTKATVVTASAGVVAALRVARRPRFGGPARRRLMLAYAAIACTGWPLVAAGTSRGTLELLMIDVGQGDAIAVRTPGGRWLLVDAGPPPRGDPAAHPVVGALRARGVRRLEAMILTHPDADHFGGAAAVLGSVDVGRVLDPVLPAGKRAYADLLAAAGSARIPWSPAFAGQRWTFDGVTVEVMHPPSRSDVERSSGGDPPPVAVDANVSSVVLRLSWRSLSAVLTGDAYTDVERALMDEVGDVDVLKVGHHGSDTSTDVDFLATVRPEWALVSVGRRNRYGHPSPRVLARLKASGAEVVRTDESGDARLLVDRWGRIRVVTGR